MTPPCTQPLPATRRAIHQTDQNRGSHVASVRLQRHLGRHAIAKCDKLVTQRVEACHELGQRSLGATALIADERQDVVLYRPALSQRLVALREALHHLSATSTAYTHNQ
jgi:hypothetical protein